MTLDLPTGTLEARCNCKSRFTCRILHVQQQPGFAGSSMAEFDGTGTSLCWLLSSGHGRDLKFGIAAYLTLEKG